MKPSLAALLASASVLGCGSAERSTIDSTINDSPYRTEIVNGMPAAYSQFPSIVAVAYQYETGDFLTILCSGTLIAPNLVQTAAHCLGYFESKDLLMVYGRDELNTEGGSIVPGLEQAAHPDYDPDSGNEPSHDLGLILLKEKIPGAVVAPILPPEKYEEFLPLDWEVTIAGYGVYDVYDTTGKLYFAEVPLVKRNEFEMLVGEGKDVTSPDACSGDSGGPAYVYGDKGKMYVTGITSRAPLGTPALCGGGTWYGLPGSHMPWIEDTYKGWQESFGEEENTSFDFFPDEEENSNEDDNSSAGIGGGSGNEKAPNPDIEYPSGSCQLQPRSTTSTSSFFFASLLAGYFLRRRKN